LIEAVMPFCRAGNAAWQMAFERKAREKFMPAFFVPLQKN